MTPEVSIIVPTRDRPERLHGCLTALMQQRGVDPFEVVVVDDGSRQRTAVADAVAPFGDRVRLVVTMGIGPAGARNAGARIAAGRHLCFTDDDCAPRPDWAARMIAALREGADVVGGTTVNGRSGDRFIEVSELVVRALQDSTRRRDTHRVFIPSNNLACRRELLDAHPFDQRFRRAAGEDRAWCAAVAAAGRQLELVPEAIVAHSPDLGLGGFWRQHLRYGRAAWQFRRGPRGREWREPPGFYLGLFRAGFRLGPASLALVVVSQVATTVGFVSAALGSLRR